VDGIQQITIREKLPSPSTGIQMYTFKERKGLILCVGGRATYKAAWAPAPP